MKKGKIIIVLVSVFLLIFITGDIFSMGDSGGTDSESEQFAWYVPAPHPYFEDVKKGVEAFEKETGVRVIKQVGADWIQETESRGVEALVTRGVKYLGVYPTSPSGANALYDEITEQGVTVGNFGASTFEPTKASFFVGTPIKESAMEATEKLIEVMGGRGNILNVLEVLEDTNTVLRKEGVEEVVSKKSGVKIIQEISGMKSYEEATQKIQTAIAGNINKIDGIVATGSTAAVGVATALSEYYEEGGTRKIHAILINNHPVVEKAIKAGYVDGTIIENPYAHGYISMWLLYRMSQGEKMKANRYYVNAGILYADKNNIDTYDKDLNKLTSDIKDKLDSEYLQ